MATCLRFGRARTTFLEDLEATTRRLEWNEVREMPHPDDHWTRRMDCVQEVGARHFAVGPREPNDVWTRPEKERRRLVRVRASLRSQLVALAQLGGEYELLEFGLWLEVEKLQRITKQLRTWARRRQAARRESLEESLKEADARGAKAEEQRQQPIARDLDKQRWRRLHRAAQG